MLTVATSMGMEVPPHLQKATGLILEWAVAEPTRASEIWITAKYCMREAQQGLLFLSLPMKAILQTAWYNTAITMVCMHNLQW